MTLHELFRGLRLLFGPHQVVPQSSQRRGSLRILHAGAIVCALAAASLLSACNDYNPNLGAAASYSSSISQLTPSSRQAGCSGFMLDVIGSGFVSGATVEWNGNGPGLPTTYESDTEMLATVDSSYLAAPGTASITVSVPGQTQGNDQSNSMTFTVISPVIPANTCPAPPVFSPNIIGMDPLSGIVGTAVTIFGRYFGGVQGTSTVSFKGTQATIAATTNWTATEIATTVPAGAPLGADPVVVNVGGLTNSNIPIFDVIATPASQSVSSRAASSAAPLYAGVGNSLSLTAGARYVAYVATSADPSTSGGPGLDKIYLHDTCQGAPSICAPQTLLVSAGLDGAVPNGPSRAPSVSADGRFVAFASDASNLVSGDDNGVADIFVRDTCVGVASGCLPTTTRASLGPGGSEANGTSSCPAISADGRFIAFQSFATNLALDAAPPHAKTAATFLRDTCLGASGSCTPSTTLQGSSSSLQ